MQVDHRNGFYGHGDAQCRVTLRSARTVPPVGSVLPFVFTVTVLKKCNHWIDPSPTEPPCPPTGLRFSYEDRAGAESRSRVVTSATCELSISGRDPPPTLDALVSSGAPESLRTRNLKPLERDGGPVNLRRPYSCPDPPSPPPTVRGRGHGTDHSSGGPRPRSSRPADNKTR